MRWLALLAVGLTFAACGADETVFDAAADRAMFAQARADARERYIQQRIDAETYKVEYNGGYFTTFYALKPLDPIDLFPVPRGEFAQSAELELDANIAPGPNNDRVRIDIHNLCQMPVRIPGGALKFEVRQAGSDQSYFITENGPFTFTIYYESVIEIGAYGYKAIWIDAYDGENWLVPRECWSLSGTVEYRPSLDVPASEHGVQRKLTACHERGPWQVSHTPRTWLPDRPTWDLFKGKLG